MQDRRSFIRAMMASAGAAAAFTPAIARALAVPADRRTGTLQDVAHVVILTQENRSFDHYFGTMRGVRGYGDRFAIPAPPLPEAPDRTVLLQPNEHPGAQPALIAPFRLDTALDFGLYRPLGTPHGFTDSQAAWDNGRMGAWPRHKQNHAMAHFTRADLPFQYALAEGFTLCDAYHSAMHLCTNPNRLYIWTGTHDPLGKGNGPAIDNGYDTADADPRHHGGYLWTTYPERLMAAGIDFQIYQDMADNFTDNPLVGFHRYRTAQGAAGALLKQRTMTTRALDGLRQDVLARRLPDVSWIVAPAAQSEHPSASTPLQGADYIAQVLDALTADPAVWARTVLLINFDENDGLFDHVPPPAPPARSAGRTIGATTIAADDEYHRRSQDPADAAYLDRPYGLGPRVPLYVVSPWSRGGHVASEVFDHTSILRFLEARFGVHEPNISAWRRAVCGDLTSCFDFTATEKIDFLPPLPATAALSGQAAQLKEVRPPLPAQPAAPVQETGRRRRRATPYALDAQVHHVGGAGGLSLVNRSTARAAVFHVYDVTRRDDVPARYTVGAGRDLTHPLPEPGRALDLFILGPNGFHRRLRGRADIFSAGIAAPGILTITNLSAVRQSIAMTDCAYGAAAAMLDLAPGETRQIALDLSASHGWYDRQFTGSGQTWRIAGHLEDGKPSWSDPAAGGAGPLRIAAVA